MEKISRDEMRTYIEQRINEQRKREADEFIAGLDPKVSNKVTFDAFIRDNYGDVDIKELEKPGKSEPHIREARRQYSVDKQRWAYLDEDGDKSLTYEEFQRFLRPEDDEELSKIEIDSMLKEYDEDHDGKISTDEYLKMTEAESGQPDVLGEELDLNNDGFADFDELVRYYLPSLSSTTEEETDHLLKECDADKDGYCTSDEVVKAYSSFAGSQITDFGADLESAREEL